MCLAQLSVIEPQIKSSTTFELVEKPLSMIFNPQDQTKMQGKLAMCSILRNFEIENKDTMIFIIG